MPVKAQRSPLTVRRDKKRVEMRSDSIPAHSLLVKVLWDSQMRVVRWSPESEAVFGWTAEEVLGKRIGEWPFISADSLPSAEAALVRVGSETGRRDVVRLQHQCKNGSALWCEWHNYAVADGHSEIVCVVSCGFPVSPPDSLLSRDPDTVGARRVA